MAYATTYNFPPETVQYISSPPFDGDIFNILSDQTYTGGGPALVLAGIGLSATITVNVTGVGSKLSHGATAGSALQATGFTTLNVNLDAGSDALEATEASSFPINANNSINAPTLTLLNSSGIIGNVKMDANFPTINMNGSGSIIGNVQMGVTSIFNVNNGTSGGGVTGNISGSGSPISSSFNIGPTSTATYTVPTTKTVDSLLAVTVANSSSLTVNGQILNVTSFSVGAGSSVALNSASAISGTGTTSNSGTITIANSTGLALTGTLTNASGGTLAINETFTRANTTDNSGAITIAASKTFTNSGTLNYVNLGSGTMTGSGAFTNSGTLNYNNSIAVTNGFGFTGLFTNSNTLNINQSVTRPAATTNSGTIAIASGATFTHSGVLTSSAGTISGSGTLNITGTHNLNGGNVTVSNLTIGSSGTLNIANGAGSLTSAIQNNGTIGVAATSTNAGAITNNNTMNISAQLSGAGTIANASGGQLNLNTSANIANAITNNSGGALNVNGNTTMTNSIVNNGGMTIAANLSMAASNLTGSGTLTVSGQRTLTAATYTNTGTHATTITNSTTYDKLTCTGCAVNLSGAVLDLSNSVLQESGTYPILTGSSIVSPSSIIGGNIFEVFSLNNTGTILNIIAVKNLYTDFADSAVNAGIAAVLVGIENGTQNSQQTQLLNAINSSSVTVSAYNDTLTKLIPNVNSVIPNITTQNQTMQKIEARIAALRDDINSTGFNAGNLTPDHSVWLSGFGSLTSQGPVDENAGYSAQTLGALLGFDTCYYDDYFGFAVGISGSRVNEFSNQNYNTSTDGYHILNYGTHNMLNNNYVDWLFSGSYNKNYSSRPFAISSTNFSTTSSYDSYLGSVKLVRGKAYDFWDHYRFTPLTSIQYTYVSQQAYNETGSAAALHIAEQTKNVVTLGVGTKFAYPIDNSTWKMIGMRELRIIGTYDALTSNDETTANFVAGSSDFNVVNTPGRWGLRLGASITFAMAERLDLLLNYDLDLRKKFTDNTLLAKIRFVF